MKRLITLMAAISLLGAGCIQIIEPGERQQPDNASQKQEQQEANQDSQVTEDELEELLSEICTETGGEWNQDQRTCTCPDDMALDQDSGECLTADGTPGGERGQKMRATYEMMVACKETAGDWDEENLVCTCPDENMLDDESGECLTPEGNPDGIRGQEAREDAYRNNCENSGGEYDSDEDICVCANGETNDEGVCPDNDEEEQEETEEQDQETEDEEEDGNEDTEESQDTNDTGTTS